MDDGSNTAKTCVFQDNEGAATQQFTVQPHDLICVKPLDIAKVFVDTPTSQAGFHPWAPVKGGAEHVGFVFDPAWPAPEADHFRRLRSDRAGWTGVEVALAGGKMFLDNMWLVDFRIKRKAWAAGRKPICRSAFYGNHCRFVEVKERDADWELDGRPLACGRQGGGSVFGFIEKLKAEYARYNVIEFGKFGALVFDDSDADDGYNNRGPPDEHRGPHWQANYLEDPDNVAEASFYGAQLGVLAYESWE
jgi:hypothetical protein